MIESRLCTQKDFDTHIFKNYVKEINHNFHYHRKLWEFISIIDTLHSLDLLKEGKRGLGFAVGTEPLSSYFIKYGCKVIVSDFITDNSVWENENQLGKGIESLNKYNIIKNSLLKNKAKFRSVDMNNIPQDLKRKQFDFVWSSCAFEHLGSLEKGLDFVKDSLNCLKVGGFAIHTTEYNLDSNFDTFESNDAVIYRKKDFEKLEEMVGDNFKLYPINYNSGKDKHDKYIDEFPYSNEFHLKLNLFGYTTTSILIILECVK